MREGRKGGGPGGGGGSPLPPPRFFTVLPSIIDYLATRGIYPDPYKSKGGGHDRLWFRCPFHEPDHDPSFYVSQTQNVWRCPVCTMGGGVKRLIALLEFNGRDDRETWYAVSRRCEELVGMGGVPSPPQHGRETREEEGERHLTTHQIALLDRATAWWHDRLWDPTRGACQARDYLIGRGVTCRAMGRREIGYVPHDRDGGYTRSLMQALHLIKQQESTTPDFQEEDAAIHLGLFHRRGDHRLTLRFQGRILFSSCDEAGHTRYYQGRVVGSQEPTTRYKYLGASLPKYPFSLPVEHPVVTGTVGTESPLGPLVLFGHDIAGIATCGAGIPSWVLARFRPPLYWAQDNDAPKLRKVGDHVEEMFPGEEQAARTLEQCRLLGIPAYRIRPPACYKGLDEWIAAEGSPLPFFDTIRA